MRKSTRFLGLALAGVAALLLPLKADAVCSASLSFGSYYSFVTGTDNGPALRANFWLLNNGNPALAAGIDNGAIPEQGIWLAPYAGTANLAVLGNWAGQLYDGCPEGAGTQDSQRMVMSFSDVDGQGNMTYAVSCAHREPSLGIEFDFTRPSQAPIALVPALKASITNTTRAGNEATITVGVPNFAPGFYTDGSSGCDVPTVIPQFDVYKQQTGRGVAPAATTDATVGGPWVLVTTCNTSGSPACVVTTTCGATNCDNYLAVVPHYNSNFSTAEAATQSAPRVSARSANVQAGPTLAVTPKSKVIRNDKVGGKQIQN